MSRGVDSSTNQSSKSADIVKHMLTGTGRRMYIPASLFITLGNINKNRFTTAVHRVHEIIIKRVSTDNSAAAVTKVANPQVSVSSNIVSAFLVVVRPVGPAAGAPLPVVRAASVIRSGPGPPAALLGTVFGAVFGAGLVAGLGAVTT